MAKSKKKMNSCSTTRHTTRRLIVQSDQDQKYLRLLSSLCLQTEKLDFCTPASRMANISNKARYWKVGSPNFLGLLAWDLGWDLDSNIAAIILKIDSPGNFRISISIVP